MDTRVFHNEGIAGAIRRHIVDVTGEKRNQKYFGLENEPRDRRKGQEMGTPKLRFLPQTSNLLRSPHFERHTCVKETPYFLAGYAAGLSQREKPRVHQKVHITKGASTRELELFPGLTIRLTEKLMNLLAIVVARYPKSRILRDFYREHECDVYDEVFRHLFLPGYELPVLHPNDIMETEVFIISPRSKLIVDYNKARCDYSKGIMVNHTMLNPTLIEKLPKSKRNSTVSSSTKDAKWRNKEAKFLSNFSCNQIELIDMPRGTRNLKPVEDSVLPYTLSLFSKGNPSPRKIVYSSLSKLRSNPNLQGKPSPLASRNSTSSRYLIEPPMRIIGKNNKGKLIEKYTNDLTRWPS